MFTLDHEVVKEGSSRSAKICRYRRQVHSATTNRRVNMVTTDRWGPSEWFGHDIETMTQEDRLRVAQDALLPSGESGRACPHLSAVTRLPYLCTKAGGVCTVQKYSSSSTGQISLQGHRVAICPLRLISSSVLNEIARNVLGSNINVVLVKEVPYSFSLTKTLKSGEPAAAGRIDWLLVDESDPSRFCAVETQSVYMSGTTQDITFGAFVAAGGLMAMPPEHRQPDYRSSVPKRLGPQLENKARHLSSTNRKTVVIVDEYVRSNMSPLQEIPVPGAYAGSPERAVQHKLNCSEVIFVIVKLNAYGGLEIAEILYCTISSALASLSAVSAMSHSDFEAIVAGLVDPASRRADKVFRLS